MRIVVDAVSESSGFAKIQREKSIYSPGTVQNEYELPRMPPWFAYVGSEKLYQTLAGILRLVGLSLCAGSHGEGSLSIIIDIALGNLRNLVSEIRIKEYSKESWYSWYSRTGSGRLVREASTAVCILNEVVYGLSEKAVNAFARMFQNCPSRWREIKKYNIDDHHEPDKVDILDENVWKISLDCCRKSNLLDCIGTILHEYLSSEVWNLPLDQAAILQQSESADGDISLHFFHDNSMLHQVMIDGIGIFSLCLGKDFSLAGFLHSSLYTLLQNLICSNFLIRRASDAVLHVISTIHGYPSVGHLVLANSDYVIDSICRELRHLDLNPHVPNVLAVMLSYVGVAHKVLPLLEEPMRAVSTELEILGRHQHPDLTVPFLKAVGEIAKVSKIEASKLPDHAESYCHDVRSKMVDVEKKLSKQSGYSRSQYDDDIDEGLGEPGMCNFSSDAVTQIKQWESILFNLNDSKRYRQTVGSIASSCLIAATPLLASARQSACLVALDIVEEGILALAKVEEAYKYEKETKDAIGCVCRLCAFYNLQDTLDMAEDESKENRVLPTANKLWPFLIACVRNKNPVAVRRCLNTISNVVQVCGGDFFSRRFLTEGVHIWKLLSSSPFQKKTVWQGERTPLQLPYRRTSASSEDMVAEATDIKVQAAVLNMIADLARNKKSSSALEAVLKKVSGIAVGIACSGVTALRDASTNALAALASIDPDLIWLLLADVYYSKKKDIASPPAREFPEMSEILPPALSSKGYLYVQYGGQSYGFDIEFSSVETVFRKLHSDVFTSQVYL